MKQKFIFSFFFILITSVSLAQYDLLIDNIDKNNCNNVIKTINLKIEIETLDKMVKFYQYTPNYGFSLIKIVKIHDWTSIKDSEDYLTFILSTSSKNIFWLQYNPKLKKGKFIDVKNNNCETNFTYLTSYSDLNIDKEKFKEKIKSFNDLFKDDQELALNHKKSLLHQLKTNDISFRELIDKINYGKLELKSGFIPPIYENFKDSLYRVVKSKNSYNHILDIIKNEFDNKKISSEYKNLNKFDKEQLSNYIKSIVIKKDTLNLANFPKKYLNNVIDIHKKKFVSANWYFEESPEYQFVTSKENGKKYEIKISDFKLNNEKEKIYFYLDYRLSNSSDGFKKFVFDGIELPIPLSISKIPKTFSKIQNSEKKIYLLQYLEGFQDLKNTVRENKKYFLHIIPFKSPYPYNN
ncbi:hypothetical protein [Polaribacter sp.]|uniref:hypothetical protein n=1 Tax=Polaribacter sp. TaxID=1920175 RepID=UPI003F6A182F